MRRRSSISPRASLGPADGLLEALLDVERLEQLELALDREVGRVAGRVGQRAGLRRSSAGMRRRRDCRGPRGSPRGSRGTRARAPASARTDRRDRDARRPRCAGPGLRRRRGRARRGAERGSSRRGCRRAAWRGGRRARRRCRCARSARRCGSPARPVRGTSPERASSIAARRLGRGDRDGERHVRKDDCVVQWDQRKCSTVGHAWLVTPRLICWRLWKEICFDGTQGRVLGNVACLDAIPRPPSLDANTCSLYTRTHVRFAGLPPPPPHRAALGRRCWSSSPRTSGQATRRARACPCATSSARARRCGASRRARTAATRACTWRRSSSATTCTARPSRSATSWCCRDGRRGVLHAAVRVAGHRLAVEHHVDDRRLAAARARSSAGTELVGTLDVRAVAAERLDQPVVAARREHASRRRRGRGYSVRCGLRISPQAASLPITTSAGRPRRVSVSNSKPLSPKAPSPCDDAHRGVRLGRQDADREGDADAEAAQRTRIEPAPGAGDVHDARRGRDHVAAVADDVRVVGQHPVEVGREAVVVQRGRVRRGLGEQRGLRLVLGGAQPREPGLAVGPARAPRPRRRGPTARRRRRRRCRRRPGGCDRARWRRRWTWISCVSRAHVGARPKPRRKSSGAPTTSATSASASASRRAIANARG